MKLANGLYVNLIGVIKNPSFLPDYLKRDKSVYVSRNPETRKETKAYITFRHDSKNNHFNSPLPEISESDINYFLMEVVNAYRGGSRMAVKSLISANKWKDKPVRTDKRKIQRCRVNGRSEIIRVDVNGKAEIYSISAPTVNDKKEVISSTIFCGNLPFENTNAFQNMIKRYSFLEEHKNDLKRLYDLVTAQKSTRFSQRLDLSQAKHNLHKQSKAKTVSQSKAKQTSQKVKRPRYSSKRRTDPEKKKKVIKQKIDDQIAKLNLDPHIVKKLSKEFKSFENLKQASKKEITKIKGIKQKQFKRIEQELKGFK